MGIDWHGSRVLVTGASSGIGAGLAEEFARRGAVVGLSGRDASRLGATAERCRAHGATVHEWLADLGDAAAVERLATDALAEMGGVDVLVNNAGIPKRRNVRELDATTVDAVMQVNFLGPTRLTLALLPQMIEHGEGRVINVSSVAATLSSPGEAAYDASKSALSVFSEAMAIDLWDNGIKVLVVYPGVVDTPLFQMPDNDPFTAPVEFITVEQLVGETFDALDRGALEVYIPAYFKDFVTGKANNVEGFVAGSAEYVRQQAAGVCMTAPAHPLDTLTADEVRQAVAIIAADARFEPDAAFVHVRLHEPNKAVVLAHQPDTPVDREIEALLVPPTRLEAIEVVVSVTKGEIRSWIAHEGMRPALLFGESFSAIVGVKAHPEWQAALRRRGIDDFELVQIDPWPAGSFGVEHEAGRRISRCISYLRGEATDNGYAQPIEGVIAFFDQGAGEVLEVIDLGVVPMPAELGHYLPGKIGPFRDDLKPLEIVQPEGASFVVDGNHVSWSRWSFRVGFDPYEGLVLHTVDYHDGDRIRPVLHRASISEMVVPYGDPGAMHGWKNAFDAGEWGLGRMANSLKLGCDCLGVIHYFDAVLATEQGEPYTVEHAVCMHEEDYGILWKHHDLHGGTDETRRSRRLVVSFISTVGNYEYGFYWYFYLDGNIQLEVKLTGIVSPMAITPGAQPDFANVIAPGLAAPHHQHLFSARLDLDVDGPVNSVYEIEAETLPAGPDNPWGNAFHPRATQLSNELAARRDMNAATSRTWRVVNESSRNALGQPVGYKLVPTMATPTMLASPESSVGKRAGFARHNLWVTPYEPDERRAAGEFPNQHEGGDGLPRWTAADRSLVDTDVVLWYTFGVTHFVRPEDWPVMPVEYTGFLLSPFGFFDRNPALDVATPTSAESCHAS